MQDWTREELMYRNQISLVEEVLDTRPEAEAFLSELPNSDKELFTTFFVPCKEKMSNFRAYLAALRSEDMTGWERANKLLRKFYARMRIPADDLIAV